MNNEKDASESVRLVLLHDDEAALNCADRVCQTLKAERPAGCQVESVSWSFAVLESPVVRHAAHERARDADMVFCARSDLGPLPTMMIEWFEQLAAPEAAGERAIVLLHPAGTDQPLTTLPTWLFLKQLCSTAGMDFFARACDPCFTGKGKAIWTELRFENWHEKK